VEALCSEERLAAAIRTVAAGGVDFDIQICRLRDEFAALTTDNGKVAKRTLSTRQYEIAVRYSNGQSTEDLAAMFRISVSTVETHLKRIYEKTGAHNRLDLRRCLEATGRRC